MRNSNQLDLWWVIPGVLAGMSMPFIHPQRWHSPRAARDAFPDELPALWRAGIRAIVPLLQAPGLARVYADAGFACHLLPLADGSAPTLAQFREFHAFVEAQRALGHAVAAHCEAGIGRTGTLIAGYLIANGLTPEAALAGVRSRRPGAVETARQWQFLRELGARRGGTSSL